MNEITGFGLSLCAFVVWFGGLIWTMNQFLRRHDAPIAGMLVYIFGTGLGIAMYGALQ